MTLVGELDLPELDHGVDRAAGEFILRSRVTAFPGRQIAALFGITAGRDGRLLTFGAGQHYCLGAKLARAELEEALGFLAPRMPGLDLDGPASFGGILGIYGVEASPLRWSGAAV